MTGDALFWQQIHFEMGQSREYEEFRQTLAQMVSSTRIASQAPKSRRGGFSASRIRRDLIPGGFHAGGARKGVAAS
jgi:hypothetical protein